MAVTAAPYGKFLLGLGLGQYDFTSATPLKMMLVTSAYTPNIDTDEFITAASANEVTSAGYTAGGATLTGLTWAYDATNDRAVLNAATVTLSGVTFTARFAVFYKDTATPGTSRLVGYLDFLINRAYASEDFQISFPNGVVRIGIAP